MKLRLSCGGKQLITNKLEEASEWILDNIAGLRTFEIHISIHSEDLGCPCFCFYINDSHLEEENDYA